MRAQYNLLYKIPSSYVIFKLQDKPKYIKCYKRNFIKVLVWGILWSENLKTKAKIMQNSTYRLYADDETVVKTKRSFAK